MNLISNWLLKIKPKKAFWRELLGFTSWPSFCFKDEQRDFKVVYPTEISFFFSLKHHSQNLAPGILRPQYKDEGMFAIQSVWPAIPCNCPSPPVTLGPAALNTAPQSVKPREGDQQDEGHSLHQVTPHCSWALTQHNGNHHHRNPEASERKLLFLFCFILNAVLNRKQA